MINKAEILIISRYLKPKDRDGFLKVISNFSFIGIMLGVATLIIVMSLMNGFRINLFDKLLSYQPHISYMSKGDYKFEKKEILKLSKENKIQITDINLVKNSEALILTKKNNFGVLIKSFHNNEIKKNYFLKNSVVRGKINGNGIGIGLELANKLSLDVGDAVTLLSKSTETTPFGLIPKQFNFTVNYIFNTGMYEFDKNFIITNLDQGLLISDNENEIEIKINDPNKAIFFTGVLKKKNPKNFVYSWVDTKKKFFDAINLERNVMFIILTLIVIVAAFNIISGLTILIKNKTKEIAIIKTLGLSEKSIIKSFFLTGFTIGFLATITGVFLGVIFSIYIDQIRNILSMIFGINIFPSDVYYLEKMPSEINVISVCIVFFLSLLITSLASYFPAKTISKMKTTDALKYE